MNTKVARFVAVAVPVLMKSALVFANDPTYHVPGTDRAQDTQVLLAQAARAVTADAASNGVRVSDLWVYPTSDQNNVFAQYVVRTESPVVGVSARSSQHLVVVRMDGGQIAEQHELTSDKGVAYANHNGSGTDRTAAIGSGHAADAVPTRLASGVPAVADWSASIGTGHSIEPVVKGNSSAKSLDAVTARAHWTSKFGTAHAVDSEPSTAKARVAS